jgi:hypothetical protein
MVSIVRFVAGRRFNILETGRLSVSSESTTAPRTRLYDGRPSVPYAAAAAVANLAFTIDGDTLLGDGSMDAWSGGLPQGWTLVKTGTGGVTQVAAGAGSAAQLASGTGTVWLKKDIVVRSGEQRDFTIALAVDSGTIKASVQNVRTGAYMTAAGAWQAALTYFASKTYAGSSAYATTTVATTVEDIAVCQADTVTLRLMVGFDAGSLVGRVDDFYSWPYVDVASIHSHNIAPANPVEWRTSTDNFVSSDVLRATLLPIEPTFYKLLSSPVSARYHKLIVTGTPEQIVETGQAVIAATWTSPRNFEAGFEMKRARDARVSTTESGDVAVIRRSRWSRRVFGLKFDHISPAAYERFALEVFERSGGQENPLVIIPDPDRADILFARIDRSYGVTRVLENWYQDGDLTALELSHHLSVD